MKSLAPSGPADAALSVRSHFRVEFYGCLYKRADALFELADAVLCTNGLLRTPQGRTSPHEAGRPPSIAVGEG